MYNFILSSYWCFRWS